MGDSLFIHPDSLIKWLIWMGQPFILRNINQLSISCKEKPQIRGLSKGTPLTEKGFKVKAGRAQIMGIMW